jgi:hypothetical protein
MAANQNKILSGGIPESNTVNVSTANTSNAVVASPSDAADFRLLFTAGTNGAFIDEIIYQVIGTGTQAAAILHIWQTQPNGANARVIRSYEIAVGAGQSATVAGQSGSVQFNFRNMKAGTLFFVSVTVVSTNCTWNITANGGQFEAQ